MRALIVILWMMSALLGLIAMVTVEQSASAGPPAGNRFFCFYWRTIRNDQTRCLPPAQPPPGAPSVLKTIVGNPAAIRPGEDITYRIEYSTRE